jgi:hypothetical protein
MLAMSSTISVLGFLRLSACHGFVFPVTGWRKKGGTEPEETDSDDPGE